MKTRDEITVYEALRMAFDYAGYYKDKSPFEVADLILEYGKKKSNGGDTSTGTGDESSTGTNEATEDTKPKE